MAFLCDLYIFATMNENKFSYEKSINRIKEISEILKNNPTQFEENLELFERMKKGYDAYQKMPSLY